MIKIIAFFNTAVAFVKKYIWIIVLAAMLALGSICAVQCSNNQKLRQQYEVSKANEKSLWGRIEGNQKDIVAYQTTIQSLKHINDSTVQHLLDKQKELNIKNKELQSMLSLVSNFHTIDTLYLLDTIFKEPDFVLDTTIKDEWRSTSLHLQYPGDICVDTKMKSQKEVFTTAVRETVDPPKKCWFLRLFQKKHTVVRVRIEEDNPHLESEENVYIQVIDD